MPIRLYLYTDYNAVDSYWSFLFFNSFVHPQQTVHALFEIQCNIIIHCFPQTLKQASPRHINLIIYRTIPNLQQVVLYVYIYIYATRMFTALHNTPAHHRPRNYTIFIIMILPTTVIKTNYLTRGRHNKPMTTFSRNYPANSTASR